MLKPILELDPNPLVKPDSEMDPGPLIGNGPETYKLGSELRLVSNSKLSFET